jgi:dephospho-CoA kinase
MIQQIGLTGGIGSGKSTVARAFMSLGYHVYFADDRAKVLYDEDNDLKTSVKELLGDGIYDDRDNLIRSKLAERIFTNKELLAKINALVHPAVGRDYQLWLKALPKNYEKKFVLKEAAILYESGSYKQCDGVLMVYAPIGLRLDRVATRDQTTLQQVQARMAHQWPDSRKMLRADFVIFNDGVHPITRQIAAAIQFFDQR